MSVPCRTPRGNYNWTPESTVTPAKPTTTPAAFTTATAANALTLAAKHEEKHEDLVSLLVPSPSNDVQTHCRMRALDWASPRCAGVRACEVCDTRGGHDARVSSESGPAAGRRPPFLSRRGRSTWPRSCCPVSLTAGHCVVHIPLAVRRLFSIQSAAVLELQWTTILSSLIEVTPRHLHLASGPAPTTRCGSTAAPVALQKRATPATDCNTANPQRPSPLPRPIHPCCCCGSLPPPTPTPRPLTELLVKSHLHAAGAARGGLAPSPPLPFLFPLLHLHDPRSLCRRRCANICLVPARGLLCGRHHLHSLQLLLIRPTSRVSPQPPQRIVRVLCMLVRAPRTLKDALHPPAAAHLRGRRSP